MLGLLAMLLTADPAVLSNPANTHALESTPVLLTSPYLSSVCTSATATTLCDSMAAGDKSGSWWCLKGDGTMLSGSAITLSAIGSPITQSWPVCPSGTGCTNETQIQLNPTTTNTQYYASGNITPPTGSFTTCVLGNNDQPSDPGGTFPEQSLLTLAGALQDGTDTTWATYHGSVLPHTVYCSSAAGYDCGNGVSSGVTPRLREAAFECGVFAASTQTRSCTFYKGDAAMTCVDFTHARASILTTSRAWRVGFNSFTTAGYWHGMVRGAFMTEKVLSSADMLRLAQATNPATIANTVFARSTKAACCPDTERCVMLGPSVPCAIGGLARREPATTNEIQSSERVPFTYVGDAAPRIPTTFVVAIPTRFGITTGSTRTTRAAFAATTPTAQYSAGNYSGFVISGSDVVASILVKGVASSGVIDVCIYDGVAGIAGYHCSANAFNSSTWTTAYVHYGSSASPIQVFVGNMSIGTNSSTSTIDVYLAELQVEIVTGSSHTAPTSRINTNLYGAPQSRGAETCTGTCCGL